MHNPRSVLEMSFQKDSVPPDETVGPIWLGVSSSLVVLLLATTAFRLWARFGRRNLGWDDYTIALAAITATVRYAFGVMQLPHGNGRHRVYLSDHDYMMINMYGWWGQLFHFTSMAFLKVSLCLLVIRIQSNKPLRVLLYAVMFGSVIINFAVVIILVAECRPVGFWRGNGAQCWPNSIRIYAIWISIAYSVLSDLLCSFLPLTVVWKIKIPSQKKVMVTSLMSLGLVATAFGIVRAQSLSVSEADLSWDFCITAIWSNLELFLGISAANLALSRAMYLYFVAPSEDSVPGGRYDPSSHGYIRSDRFQTPAATIINSSPQQRPTVKTLSGDVPLVPWLPDGIEIKREFRWEDNTNPQGPHEESS
ncbi:integral membrane protein [Colletotrichum incanum]|uniref:Integral membrane protein n=1 Tax=Colletotrichum incanum TaxID=1573173 RepID=A0A162Q5P4_COLIC|nr:integral membrane protein [Colletotrichum incanum]